MVSGAMTRIVVLLSASSPALLDAQEAVKSQDLSVPPADRPVKYPPPWTMTREMLARVEPTYGGNPRAPEGMPYRRQYATNEIWSAPVPATNRKLHLLGRPCSYAIFSGNVVTPFENRVLNRDWIYGGFDGTVRPLPGTVEQIVPSRSGFVEAIVVTNPENEKDVLLLRQWDISKPRILKGHTAHPWRVVFSPKLSRKSADGVLDETRMASCSDDGNTRLWDVETGVEIASYPGPALPPGAIVRGEFPLFSASGDWLGIVSGNLVSLCRASDGGVVDKWTIPANEKGDVTVTSICFEQDSEALLAFVWSPMNEKSVARFYELNRGQTPVPFQGTSRAITGICLPSKECVVSRNEGPDLSVWSLMKRRQLSVVPVAKKKLYDIALAPSNEVIAIAGDEDEIKFLDVTTWTFRETEYPYVHNGVDFVGFGSSINRFMVTSSDDGVIKSWESPRFATPPSESERLNQPPMLRSPTSWRGARPQY